MAEDIDNYELVSVYRLNPEDQEQLLLAQRECVFNWCTRDNWPMGVIMSYIWRNDRVWLTAGAHRHRISAVRRNPKPPTRPAPASPSRRARGRNGRHDIAA